MTMFADSYLSGSIKPLLLSQEVPSDWDAGLVKVLVAPNHDEVVLDPARSAFVLYYAPWCAHCKRLGPVMDELAETVRLKLPSVVVAKMDATQNEVESIKVANFPALKLVGEGSNEVIDYPSHAERGLLDLRQWLITNVEELQKKQKGAQAVIAEPNDEL